MSEFIKKQVARAVKAIVEEPVSEETVNRVLGMREWAPGLKAAKVKFGDGEAGIEAEVVHKGIVIKVKAAAKVKGLTVTAEEKVVKLIPLGPILASTPHQRVRVELDPGPELIEEWRVLLSKLPEPLKSLVSVESDCLVLCLHRVPGLNDEINKKTVKEVLGKKIAVFDYVTVKDIKIRPGVVRIVAG